ncbi:hypothetical protein LOK49_LG10G00503 [Camellia lanceoleosa]|uniref:Uncharacterized protein n=1 Tax=Camellia lanceoleosa TaxID=1840588 RepID=A0ACC0G9U9_9ERIC|nr:hypothetical protein LOK49_LG10G00503 [Camellia lanceoleosa]
MSADGSRIVSNMHQLYEGEYAADLGCCFMGFPESGSADVGLCLICINSKLCCMLLFGLQYAIAQRPSGRRLLRNAAAVCTGLV